MAEAETVPATESVKPTGNVIEDMISNLKLDVEAREEHQEHLESAKEFISEADVRIKKGGQALSFMTEYMTQEQVDVVNGLDIYYEDLEPSSNNGSLNDIAQNAFDTLTKSKTGQMTNGELYESYVKQAGDDPVKYGMFNIKLRSLFSNMRLLRVEPEDSVNSRDHIIKVNGFKAGK